MSALFGSWDSLHRIRTLDDALDHFDVPDAIWRAFEVQVGSPGSDLRLLAALPKVALVAGCGNAVTDQGPLTPMQATQVGLVWRLARRVMAAQSNVSEAEFVDIDPWLEGDTRAGGDGSRSEPTPGRQSGGVKERVLKMSSLIDQQDESELLPPSSSDVDRWYQSYIVTMGSPPDESEEPTPSQLAALHKKVFIENRPPYCDFSVWTPFERRMSRIQKCRIYTPLGDGTYLQKDLPGPGSYTAWKASWNVFRAACIMLNICSMASLEAYSKQVEKLTTQWPRCWGLIYCAEDSARAERLEKWRRRLTIEAAQNRQTPRDWDPLRPWSCIFIQVAADMEFWAEKVHHPAAAWTAAGGRGAPTVATEAAVLDVIQGGPRALQQDAEGGHANQDGRRTQANRDRRAAKRKRLAAEREELTRYRSSTTTSNAKGGGTQKGKGTGKSKDQSGLELCFSWAAGKGHCADVPPGGECKGPTKRVHKCRICLSPSHRDADCRAG
eukprot:s2755_g6.t1